MLNAVDVIHSSKMSDETTFDTMEAQSLLSPTVTKKGRKPKLASNDSNIPIKKTKKEKQTSYEQLSAETATTAAAAAAAATLSPLTMVAQPKQWFAAPNVMKMVLSLSEGRSVRVTTNLIVLEDEVQAKFVSFNFQKLSKIMEAVHAVDESIEKMKNYEDSNLRIDIAGNWYLTMTTGVKCVDIRRWFRVEKNYRPSKNGMALRLSEWQLFKQRVKTIHQLRPDIAAVTPCYRQQDHNDQLGNF